MKTLEQIISIIKEIDKDLDAYEFNGYTFDEYNNCINNKVKGNNSLRHLRHNKSNIWTSWMQEGLDNSKEISNKIFLYEKKQYIINTSDIENIEKLSKRLKESQSTFYKNTDKYSIYPIQSEAIGNNLILLSKLFVNIINEI